MARIERLFRRYQRKRDAAALAAVFDECAPEVLRLALHFAGDLAIAEELLQDTFLTAIDTADRYVSSRRVMPWLLGILGNHARNARRKEARAPNPERLPLRVVPAASAYAEQADEHDAAWAALDSLKDPYREVLVLHLRHGLSVTAVAHVLDRAPATVRSQLHRGLEQVRGRLPADALRNARASVPAGIGLASVRSAVVSHASALAPIVAGTATTVSIGGMVAMKKSLFAAVAVVALAGVGGALWVHGDSSTEEDVSSDRSALLASEPEDTAHVPTLVGAPKPKVPVSDDPMPKRSDLSASAHVPLDAPIPKGKGSVSGTITFDDGTPVAGRKVALWGSSPIESSTDENGAFHLHGEWVNERAIYFKGQPRDDNYDDAVILSESIVMKVDERVHVEVVIARGYTLQGRLVDARDNTPLVDTFIVLRRPSNKGQARYATDHTDADGRFEIAYLPEERYTVEVNRPGFEPHLGEVTVTRQSDTLDIALKPARKILVNFSGVPADAAGRMVNWSFSKFDGQGHYSPGGKAALDAKGRLYIDAPPPGRYSLILFSTKSTQRYQRQYEVTTGELKPIYANAKPPGFPVAGTLRASGESLSGKRIFFGERAAKLDAGGHFAFDKISRGKHVVWLEVGASRLRIGEVETREPVSDLELQLQGTGELRFHLRSGPGSAALGGLMARDNRQLAMIQTIHDRPTRLPYLPVGTHRLMLLKHGFRNIVRQVTIAADGVTDLGTINMVATPFVELRISMSDGSIPPKGHLLATLRTPSESERPGAGRASNTQGTLSGLIAGRYDLVFTLPGCHSIDRTVEVKANAPTIELVFDRK